MIEVSTSKDYLAICILGQIINEDFSKLYPKTSLYNEYSKIIVYKIKNEIIAFLHYEILPDTISIINLVVSLKFRQKHIATDLLNYMFDSITNLKYQNIILEVNSTNIPAINLYKKFNFKIINIRKKYYNGIDGYVMERRNEK